MDQNIWGPGSWLLLHSISFNYTKNKKTEVLTFLNALSDVLPCRYCRESMKKHMKKLPPNLNSRRDFVTWMIDFHNLVNVSLNKPVITFDEAISIYEKMYDKKLKLDDDSDLESSSMFDINNIADSVKSIDTKTMILLVTVPASLWLLYTLTSGGNKSRSKRR